MNELFNSQTFVVAIISLTLTILVTAVIFILYKKLKITYYNIDKQRVEIESFRSTLEKELYKINDRLTSDKERWRDLNHLLIREEYLNEKPIKLNKRVVMNDFLRSNGILSKHLEIDHDLIFVLTPFNERFNNEYEIIRNICSDVGFKCVRGDENYFNSDIFSEILKLIVKSNLIIANINGKNPNVLYELGISQALDKPIILIAKNPENLPIDIKSKRFIVYNNTDELKALLKNELIKLLKSEMSKKENEELSKCIKIDEWKAMTQINNIQWTDYKEIDLNGYLLESISCSLIPNSDYMRFGFKILDKNAKILGQGWIPSPDNSMLIHIGKEINDSKIGSTYYKGETHLKDVLAIPRYVDNEQIQLKLLIDNSNLLKFTVNDKELYSCIVNYDMRERIVLLAWGDNHDYKLTVNDIDIRLR